MRLKGDVVTADERDSSRRAVLNFGHTVAHALEAVSDYALSHGRAVAVGMCVEARLAVGATGFPAAAVARLEALVAALGLPTRVPGGLPAAAVVAATGLDKKVREGRVRYSLPVAIGRVPPGDDPTVALGAGALEEALAASN